MERSFSHDARNISQNVASLNIFVHDMMNLLYEHWTDKQKKFTYKGNLCLEERNDNFRRIRGMRYLSNNLVANKETGESLIEIYIT